jgi:hypothetical protein
MQLLLLMAAHALCAYLPSLAMQGWHDWATTHALSHTLPRHRGRRSLPRAQHHSRKPYKWQQKRSLWSPAAAEPAASPSLAPCRPVAVVPPYAMRHSGCDLCELCCRMPEAVTRAMRNHNARHCTKLVNAQILANCPAQINGFTVLKANNYDLEQGERSVFDQELNRESSMPYPVVYALWKHGPMPLAEEIEHVHAPATEFTSALPDMYRLHQAKRIWRAAGNGAGAQGVLGEPAVSRKPQAAHKQQQQQRQQQRQAAASARSSGRALDPVEAARKAHNDAVRADAQVTSALNP